MGIYDGQEAAVEMLLNHRRKQTYLPEMNNKRQLRGGGDQKSQILFPLPWHSAADKRRVSLL